MRLVYCTIVAFIAMHPWWSLIVGFVTFLIGRAIKAPRIETRMEFDGLATAVSVGFSLLLKSLFDLETMPSIVEKEVERIVTPKPLFARIVGGCLCVVSGLVAIVAIARILGGWTDWWVWPSNACAEPVLTEFEASIVDGDRSMASGDYVDAMEEFQDALAQAIVNGDETGARFARGRIFSIAAMKGDRETIDREVDVTILDICKNPVAVRLIRTGTLPDSLFPGVTEVARSFVLARVQARLAERTSLTERFMASQISICRRELVLGRRDEARLCTADLQERLDCFVDGSEASRLQATITACTEWKESADTAAAHHCLIEVAQFPEAKGIKDITEKLTHFRRILMAAKPRSAYRLFIERELQVLSVDIRRRLYLDGSFSPPLDPDPDTNRRLLRALRAMLVASVREGLNRASRDLDEAARALRTRDASVIRLAIAQVKAAVAALDREVGFTLEGTAVGDRLKARAERLVTELTYREARLRADDQQR